MSASTSLLNDSKGVGALLHPSSAVKLQRVELNGMARVSTLTGLHYLKFLQGFHVSRQVSRYLEIGTQEGKSLQCAIGQAIAIDPSFRLDKASIKSKLDVHFFEMTSDEFFLSHNPCDILGGTIDLAFIDGMHLSEFVLRDFINVERFCHKDSVVVLHDAVPQNFEVAERDRRPSIRKDKALAPAWTGDVWRVLPILERERSDLQIRILNCPPTGLVLISNLDPQSDVLSRRFEEISRELTDSEPEEQEFWEFIETALLFDSKF